MDPAGPRVVTDPAGSGAAPPREELDGRGGGGGGACSGAAAAEGSASRLAGAGLGGGATALRYVPRAFVPDPCLPPWPCF
ncbi:unnamed protein product [Miscanthus lutarioriparius]|uniref:Uncharacterized protein n=1 Tax=Miscanthus lutarioriparius TaxID=422564 RepID=A0A811QF91_9POAL|nr:unnamed protein product [Miscanthus lutarioriparius]